MLRYREIKLALLDLVSKLRVGDKLPSRTKLCVMLETTRTTLDKAIRELIDEGVLEATKGSGTRLVGMIEGTKREADNWCVIVPDATEQIYILLMKGIEKVAQRNNINTILCSSHNDGEKQEQYIKRLMVSGISGFIIVPIVSYDAQESFRLYENLLRSKIPFVFCNRGVEGVDAPVVKSCDFYGGLIATRHLIAQGYQNIAYVCEHKYSTSMERCQGYISALLEKGIDVNRRFILIPPLKKQLDCYASIRRLLASEPRPDAIFCFNDHIAALAAKAIQDAGLRLSDDVGVIGYDNTDVCTESKPLLSSVSYKVSVIGEMAALLLQKAAQGIRPSTNFNYYLFQPDIVTRESCLGPVPAQRQE